MSDTYKELQQNLNEIIDLSDSLELTLFTFELLDCIWADIIEEDDEEITNSLIEAYANEVRNSIEIMNPDLKIDIDILKKVLKELENAIS
jgi:hypothetical protein